MFDEEKMLTYLNRYLNDRNMEESKKALVYAIEKHRGQKRKEGIPYITHPMAMACDAIAMGIEEDNIIGTILLHDVCEDCGVKKDQLPVNECIKRAVALLTFNAKFKGSKEKAKQEYYSGILTNREATIVKLIDRCHNVSSMSRAFSGEKLKEYIDETRKYTLPLLSRAKIVYPEFDNTIFILKYHICSVIDSIDFVMNLCLDEKI